MRCALPAPAREPPCSTSTGRRSTASVITAHAAGLACLVVMNGYPRHQDLHEATLTADGFGDPGEAGLLAGPANALPHRAVTPRAFDSPLAAHRADERPTEP